MGKHHQIWVHTTKQEEMDITKQKNRCIYVGIHNQIEGYGYTQPIRWAYMRLQH